MKRALIGLCVAVFCLASMSQLAAADKKKKNRKPKAPETEEVTPTKDKIADALGAIKWGIGKEDLLKILTDQIREHYRPIMADTKDSLQADRLSSRMNQEIKQVRDSYEQFDGKQTGWSMGFLRDEFTQKNGEAMLNSKDQNSQNYYFFINDRLWKWYKVYNTDVFEGKTFDQFGNAVQLLLGKGKDTRGELTPGSGGRHWLEWENKDTRARAVDQMGFYGFYCVIYESREILQQLPSLRKNVTERKSKTNELVDAVTSDTNAAANPDVNPNIVDRITGRIRAQEQPAQETMAEPQPGNKASGGSKAKSADPGASPSKSSRKKPHENPEF